METSCEGKVTIWSNQQDQIDRTVPNNKLDITICDNVNRTCVNRHCSFGDRNAIKKEAEKILK
jgi:hypothetical protein